MILPFVTSASELEALINEIGFLPFFRNPIAGFSVEDCTPDEYWFKDGVDGPWEWKGQIARGRETAYGKLFSKKAGYVSAAFYPELANFRRNGYDFDSLYEEGLAPKLQQDIISALSREKSLLSCELKTVCGYGSGGMKGFDAIITALQMRTYVAVEDFEYRTDRNGAPSGWGIARYTLPETLFGYERVSAAYFRDPAESGRIVAEQIARIVPAASETQIERLIR